MKKLILISAIISLMCACAPNSYYQLYKVSTDELEQQSDKLTYENDYCIVSYNLWKEKGDLSFMLYNKTDKDIFVVMSQSFFIKNDIAYDYYSNAVHTSRTVLQSGKATTVASSYAGLLSNAATYAQTTTAESATMTKEMAVVCIPPKAAKFFAGFDLIAHAQKDCDDYDLNYPKKASDIITYDKESSPWRFRNRIAYTFDGDSKNCEYIDNELWVSYLQNYHSSEMEERASIPSCETNLPVTLTFILNQAPNAFYNTYTKTMGATRQNTSFQRERSLDDMYK